MKSATLLPFLLLSIVPAMLRGEEIQGEVTKASADSIEVLNHSEYLPNVGDQVQVFFPIPGVDAVASVASGRVTDAHDDVIVVKIDHADSPPRVGHLAKMTSESPRKRAAPASPPAGRQEANPGRAEVGGGIDTESAVGAALGWLARHQGADGSWKAAAFADQCSGSNCTHPGYNDYDTGVTGLSLLAFLGAGQTPESNATTAEGIRIGAAVDKGLRWLVNNQDADGCIGAKVSKYMYNQSICALALSEAYGMTRSQILKEPAQKAIDYLQQARNPYKAWRYTSKCGENDSSVTGWCVMALKSAERAKLSVGRSALVEANQWIDEVTDKRWGKVGYQSLEDAGVKVVVPGKNEDYAPHEALAAIGMVIRTLVDHDRKDPILEMSARLLANDLPVWDLRKKTNDYYYWYYGTMALFQFDGPDSGGSQMRWKPWSQALQAALVTHQAGREAGCARGSWDADDRWGFEGGRVYATAINALTLEVYYRYTNACARLK